MKFPDWFKVSWWVIWLSIITFYLSQRYSSFVDGSAEYFDIFVFLIWVALILFPFFKEIGLFGLKLVKEIEEFRTDIKNQVLNLRIDIQNSISVSTQVNPQIYLEPPPSDDQLPELESIFRRVIEETIQTQGVQSAEPDHLETELPDNTMYLFSIRYRLEQELRRISQRHIASVDYRRLPIYQIPKFLGDSNIIKQGLVRIILETNKICNAAVHGDVISESQVRFVRNIEQELFASLRAI